MIKALIEKLKNAWPEIRFWAVFGVIVLVAYLVIFGGSYGEPNNQEMIEHYQYNR